MIGSTVAGRTSGRGATLLVLAALATAAAGCGDRGQAAQAGRARGGMGGPGGADGGRVVPVAVAPVEVGTIARRVTVSGVVEPIRSIGVNSQLSGALLSVHVEEGDAVSAGAVLARLNDRELAAQVSSAEAAHQVAQATFQRAERLRERQVITSAEFERDRAALTAAEAQLDQLRARLGYATVRAPVAGIVTAKSVETGDIVAPNMRLFTVADVSTMVVRVLVSELDVVELSPGDRAEVGLDAFPDRPFPGRIRRIFPAADPTTRLVPVEVALEGDGASIARAGFLARVTFELGAHANSLLVPASAVVAGGGSSAVFVVDGDRAVRRQVRTGLTSEGRVEILAGLDSGEVIVVTGNNALRDGATVRVVEGSGSARAGKGNGNGAGTSPDGNTERNP